MKKHKCIWKSKSDCDDDMFAGYVALTNVIREATSLEDLWKLVGPSDEEKEESNRRLEKMDEIWERHHDTENDLYKQLAREQAIFESKYF